MHQQIVAFAVLQNGGDGGQLAQRNAIARQNDPVDVRGQVLAHDIDANQVFGGQKGRNIRASIVPVRVRLAQAKYSVGFGFERAIRCGHIPIEARHLERIQHEYGQPQQQHIPGLPHLRLIVGGPFEGIEHKVQVGDLVRHEFQQHFVRAHLGELVQILEGRMVQGGGHRFCPNVAEQRSNQCGQMRIE